jgi:succinate dehydrogenase / fumarate reductase membrane anchor subunit
LASSSTTEAEGDGSGARPRQVLLVAWRGDAFVGWQRQPAGRSVQVVLEDYVHAKGLKFASLLASTFVHLLLAAAGVYAVLRIAFTTGSF